MASNNGHKKRADSNTGVGFANKPAAAVNASPPDDEPAKKSEAAAENASAKASENQVTMTEQKDLNRIRDILFGKQVQTHEQRFEQLERKLEDESDRLRNHFDQKISKLEDRLSEHVDRLAEQIRTETSDRQTADDRLNQSLLDKEAELSRQVTGLDEKLTETRQEMLAELTHEIATLRASLEAKIEEVLANLEEETSSRTTNIEQERRKLSGLFSQMAQQLEGEK